MCAALITASRGELGRFSCLVVAGLVTGCADGRGGRGCLVGVTKDGTGVGVRGGGACRNAVGESAASLCTGIGSADTSPKVRACGSAVGFVEPCWLPLWVSKGYVSEMLRRG
jgi:hypothetical protein